MRRCLPLVVLVVLVVLVAGSLGCAAREPASLETPAIPPERVLSADDAAVESGAPTQAEIADVYVAVIEAFGGGDDVIYVCAQPSGLDEHMQMPEGHELFPALILAAAVESPLPSELPLSRPYRMLDEATLDASFQGSGAGWENFFRTYPDATGLIELSAVGFDPTHDRALVFGSRHCGGRCGGGAFFELERRDGRWRVTDRLHEYIS